MESGYESLINPQLLSRMGSPSQIRFDHIETAVNGMAEDERSEIPMHWKAVPIVSRSCHYGK